MEIHRLRQTTQHYQKWRRDLTDRPSSLNLPSAIFRLADQIGGQAGQVFTIPEPRLVILEAKLRLAARDSNFSAIKDRDWRRTPLVFWKTQENPIGAIADVTDRFFIWFAQNQHPIAAKSLITSYFEGFSDSDATRKAGSAIETFLANISRGFEAWAQRSEQFRLFDPSCASQNVATWILSAPEQIDTLFGELGLENKHWEAFGRDVLRRAISITSKHLLDLDGPNDFIQRIRAWIIKKAPIAELSQNFRIHIAAAFLTPCEKRDPAPPVQEQLKGFILELVGDPRSSGSMWRDTRLTVLAHIALRWFVRETIDLFFSVIDQSADPWHWTDRKAFWSKYNEAGAISDAWVAFGPKVMRLAQSVAEENSDRSFRFARLLDPPDKLHSVLFLRIQGLTVADYSHSGSCRFYFRDNSNSPEFYRDNYKDAIIKTSASQALAHQMNWQLRFSSLIYNQTGERPK